MKRFVGIALSKKRVKMPVFWDENGAFKCFAKWEFFWINGINSFHVDFLGSTGSAMAF